MQLTWMAAKVGDWVVTPRRGKPAEIRALWYNAICIMEELAAHLGDDAARKRHNSMAALTKWSFNRLFWYEGGSYLYDVVNGGPPDASIRPNQTTELGLSSQPFRSTPSHSSPGNPSASGPRARKV